MKIPVWWPTAALILAGFLAWKWYGHEQRIQGELKSQYDALSQQLDQSKVQAESLASAHHIDTVRLVSVRRHTDSLLITDTLIRADTVRRVVDRERLACDALVATCEAEKTNLRAQIGYVRAQLEIEKKRRPSRFGCVIGGVVSPKGAGPGAGCGIRF